MVKDLVCGMGVEEDDPNAFMMVYRGTPYFFCSDQCLLLFSRGPQEYVAGVVNEAATSLDPVCGMQVDRNNPPYTIGYNSRTYYFCSYSCKQEFIANPEDFAGEE